MVRLDFTPKLLEIRLPAQEYARIVVATGSGKIFASDLSAKAWKLNSSSGDISLPPAVSGAGSCLVQTASGDISIGIEQ